MKDIISIFILVVIITFIVLLGTNSTPKANSCPCTNGYTTSIDF